MRKLIRNVRETDLEAVLDLNQSEVPHVGSIDLERVGWFSEYAHYFRVIESAGKVVAYLIGLRPGTSYSSPNYRWFCQRYDDFAYVDRVAVAAASRRGGLATSLYDDFAATLPPAVAIMTCEVNVRPPNDASMRFHEKHGFTRVGSLASENGAKEVALLLKHLHDQD